MAPGYSKDRNLWENILAIEDRQCPPVTTYPLLFYIKGVDDGFTWQKKFLASLEEARDCCLACADDNPTELSGPSLGLPVVVYVISEDLRSRRRFVDLAKITKRFPQRVWVCFVMDEFGTESNDSWRDVCLNILQEFYKDSVRVFDNLEVLADQIRTSVKHYHEVSPGLEKPDFPFAI